MRSWNRHDTRPMGAVSDAEVIAEAAARGLEGSHRLVRSRCRSTPFRAAQSRLRPERAKSGSASAGFVCARARVARRSLDGRRNRLGERADRRLEFLDAVLVGPHLLGHEQTAAEHGKKHERHA